MNALKKILAPLASLRLTVVLLSMGMLLIFAGTLAQRDTGIWEVKRLYFSSWLVKVPFQHVLPFVQQKVPGWFPFVGGQLLIYLLLANLLAAHTVRFKFNWKRSGVLLTHFGLILLLLGELVTTQFATESQMPIDQGASTVWSHDTRATELAVTDTTPSDHDNVVAIPATWLGKNDTIKDARLPFDITVVKNYPNAAFLGPMQPGVGDSLADSGEGQKLKIQARPTIAGTQSEDVDRPTAFLRFGKDGQPLGTYLVSVVLDKPQLVKVGDKTYEVALRFKRLYKPYTVTLLKFSHDKYVGSDMPRNFSSRIRLVDPKEKIDREYLIRMNEPLRYGGETFYQASFNQDQFGVATGTVLQVVRNPGWVVPYVAVVIGAVGMVIHFGMILGAFLRRTLKDRPLLAPLAFLGLPGLAALAYVDAKNERKSTGGKNRSVNDSVKRTGSAKDSSYTLAPSRGFFTGATLFPLGLSAVCFIYILGHAIPRSVNGTTGLNLDSFASIPVSFDGRPMPIDSVARGTLKIISGRESLALANGDRVPAIQWLADLLASNRRVREYKAIRIDHPQLKALLELPPDEKLFSIDEVMTADNSKRLEDQYRRLTPDSKTWDLYQKKIAELHDHLSVFERFGQASAMADLWEAARDTNLKDETLRFAKEAEAVEPSTWTPQQREAMRRLDRWQRGANWVEFLNDRDRPANKKYDLYFAAPTKPGEEWQGLGTGLAATATGGSVNATMGDWCDLIQALRDGNAAQFNARLAEYERTLAIHPPAGTSGAGFETFFNRFDPFGISTALYVGVMLFAAVSWLGWRQPLARTAMAIAGVALLVQTFGLGARMYISGRPPVTNLYSSAVFIGWGAVIFCLVLEFLFRNGIGSFVAGAVGFGTLLVAGGLYTQSADTMGQLQAVLDTNFWLATHVVAITLGYSATFVAGILGIVFLMGTLTSAFDADARKATGKMIYGVLCFATILSFVGTILGGIWADQSWGRFWGWDPKENGAILIVLWNAVILHARWAGLARERGMALLAIFGNIVTSWSWFGTNMLGVGLHSYGFMEHALTWLGLFVTSQLILIAVGNLPVGDNRTAR